MIEILKDFYINIVGLKLGHRPPFKSKGYWLYAGSKDILHLSSSKDNIKNLTNVNSTLDHVSFSAIDKSFFLETLKKNNIIFKERYIPEINIEQLFFKDPAGNGIELIFLDKS
ncbi:MAG: diguanylate cyclase [Nitrosomonadales bacterium]|nr:diguanylate cyclase [Nitrosomonadales bacterium]